MPYLLSVTRDHAWSTYGVQDRRQCSVGGHTWESEIMPTPCWRLCRPTLGSGRTGQFRQAQQMTQQPRLLSQVIVGRLLLASVILGR